MLNKESFVEYLEKWKIYNERIGQINKLINGEHNSGLYDSEWNNAVEIMLDIFINSHFTADGADLIWAYLFEPPLIIHEKTIFSEDEVIVINDLDILWQYLVSNNYVK